MAINRENYNVYTNQNVLPIWERSKITYNVDGIISNEYGKMIDGLIGMILFKNFNLKTEYVKEEIRQECYIECIRMLKDYNKPVENAFSLLYGAIYCKGLKVVEYEDKHQKLLYQDKEQHDSLEEDFKDAEDKYFGRS